jgi:hypothetical protein
MMTCTLALRRADVGDCDDAAIVAGIGALPEDVTAVIGAY